MTVIVHYGSGAKPIDTWEPVWYEVNGLPEGQRASIYEVANGWTIKRAIDGKEYELYANHPSAQSALEDLQKRVDAEQGQ